MVSQKPEFSVSLMCMDLMRAGEQIKILNGLTDYYHVDIMDGHFAKNIAMSPDFVKAAHAFGSAPLEMHLMTENPNDWIELLAENGASTISAHAETINRDAFRVMRNIKAAGAQTGVVVNPATPLSEIEHYLDLVDLLTIMTVDVGYAGQQFIEQMLPKIEQAAKIKSDRGYEYKIQIDGSVNGKTFKRLSDAGAEVYILGSSGLFNLDEDLEVAWSKMLTEFSDATGLLAGRAG